MAENLNDIESLKTVYSDKFNVANYYAWNSGAYDEYGYFVSIVPGTATIKICEGPDIFGVTIADAGFIGNQSETVLRDNSYGLVATSGLVDVRCELDVEVGDYVVSNAYGVATKTDSGCGYKVIAIEDKYDIPYAAIALGVQACATDLMGKNLQHLDERLDVAETNIISAVNVANEAYNKASDIGVSNQAMSEKVDGALATVDKVTADVENLTTQVTQSQVISEQAKAIANTAATSAESMKNEAIAKANEALVETTELRNDFASMDEGITELENQINIIVIENGEQGTAIAGIRSEVTDHDAKINNLVSWQGTTNIAMARIEQKADANGAYIQSTVSNMDKYSVGPHSQAYGFTLEQAANVLEEGMIYVPTEDKHDDDAESYVYIDENGDTQTYTREFTKGYLYQWGKIGDQYGWITIDKNYTETDETNTSSKTVYFTATEPAVSGNFGYWYTEGDAITGTTGTYEPYTLYKWESYTDEFGATQYHWVAVATLAGNSQNRAVSQIRQDANSIELRVTNVEGSAASSKQWIDDNSANIQDVVTWKGDNADSIATTIQKASESSAYIAQIASVKNDDGTVNASASIITAVNNDTSGITIAADHINLDGAVTIGDFSSDTQNNLIKSSVIQYGLSDSETEEPTNWVDANDWGTGDNVWTVGKYVWQKTVVTKVDNTTTETTVCIQGAKGETGATLYTWIKYAEDEYGLNMSDDPTGKSYMGVAYNQAISTEGTDPSQYTWTLIKGQDSMACYMESSAGTSFEESATGTTALTAYLYEGTNEIDEDGKFTYTWYTRDKSGVDSELGEGKTLTVNVSDVAGKSVYFIADDGDLENTSVLYLARLGVMVLNKGV